MRPQWDAGGTAEEAPWQELTGEEGGPGAREQGRKASKGGVVGRSWWLRAWRPEGHMRVPGSSWVAGGRRGFLRRETPGP